MLERAAEQPANAVSIGSHYYLPAMVGWDLTVTDRGVWVYEGRGSSRAMISDSRVSFTRWSA